VVQVVLAAEQAAERARQAQADYDHYMEVQLEAKRLAEERRLEAERQAVEAAREQTRRRQAEQRRKAALRTAKVLEDETRKYERAKDWAVLS